MILSQFVVAENVKRDRTQIRIAHMSVPAVAFLVLSAAIALIRSHYRLLWGDEFQFGMLHFDQTSGLGRLIHIELTKPLWLDPIGYNVLMHSVIRVFGTSAFALRLPAIAGFLLMQVCLYYFVSRISTERAATLALAIPALLGPVFYSFLSRPYGLMVGLLALAMLSWQTASRCGPGRTLALIVLASSLVMAVNTQYYSVLFFVPLCAAESVRVLERRRVDYPMLVSILVGFGGLLIGLPFVRALAPMRADHTVSRPVSFHFVTHAYLWLFVGYMSLSVFMQHVLGAGILLILLVAIGVFFLLRAQTLLVLPAPEAVFIVSICMFPVLGYLLARFATNFVEVRYILPGIMGIAVLLGILCTPLLQNKMAGRIVLASLFAAIALLGVLHIRSDRKDAEQMLSSLALSPATQHNLDSFPGQPIYALNPSMFDFVGHYSPNPDIRSRITLVYPRPTDVTSGPFADVCKQLANMGANHFPNVASYDSVSASGTEHIFLLSGNQGDWSYQDLEESRAQMKQIGQIFGGALVLVHFPSTQTAMIANTH